LFIKRFQEEFETLYTALEDNQVDMTGLLGTQFYKAKVPPITSSMRDQFFQKMGIKIPPLTNREIEVIKYLIKGYSASRLACELFISKRTAEHHIERIKDKFNSFSKSELIQKIREFELIGYFMF
jgi:DNA-binding CsgD family transcriptional regulator